jgi:hypothetical protein
MRAGKLMILSAAAVLAGGASLATNPGVGQAFESGSSIHGGPGHGGVSHAQKMRGPYARATEREFGAAGTVTEERTHMREMMRDIPRLSNVGTNIRIDAVVPRSVRQAAAPLPVEIQHMHPHMRHDRAFIYHDKFVIVNPTTSRIVAIVKTPG